MSWQNHGPDLVGPQEGDTVTLASDADRDTAVRVLNEAFAEGRLTADEHGERVRAAYAGRTWQELAQLTADLPGWSATPSASSVAFSFGLFRACSSRGCRDGRWTKARRPIDPTRSIASPPMAWHYGLGGERP